MAIKRQPGRSELVSPEIRQIILFMYRSMYQKGTFLFELPQEKEPQYQVHDDIVIKGTALAIGHLGCSTCVTITENPYTKIISITEFRSLPGRC